MLMMMMNRFSTKYSSRWDEHQCSRWMVINQSIGNIYMLTQNVSRWSNALRFILCAPLISTPKFLEIVVVVEMNQDGPTFIVRCRDSVPVSQEESSISFFQSRLHYVVFVLMWSIWMIWRQKHLVVDVLPEAVITCSWYCCFGCL